MEHTLALEDLLSLDAHELRKLVLQLVKKLGYEVDAVYLTADGCEIRAYREAAEAPDAGLRLIVVCKRQGDEVDAEEVDRLADAVAGEGAGKGILITTSKFNEQVVEKARELSSEGVALELWDGERLLKELSRFPGPLRPEEQATFVPRLGFPPDVITRYHEALLLYEFPDTFMPSPSSKVVAISFLLRGDGLGELVSKLREKLTSEGWFLVEREIRGRKLFIAEDASNEAVMGVIATDTPEGPILSLVVSSADRAKLSFLTTELRTWLLRLCPEAEEITLKV